MSGTLYTRPTLRERTEDAIVLAAWYLGSVLNWARHNIFAQTALGLAFYASAFAFMFTETGQDITAYFLTILFCIWDISAEMTGLPRIDVGGLV